MDNIYAPHHQLVRCVKKWVPKRGFGERCCGLKVKFWGSERYFVCVRNDYGACALPDFMLCDTGGAPYARLSHLGIRQIGIDQRPYMMKDFEILKILEYEFETPIVKTKTMSDNKNQWSVTMTKSFDVVDGETTPAKIEKETISFDDQDYDPSAFVADLSARLSVKAKYEKEFGKIKK